MWKLVLFIFLYPSISTCQTVEQKYGDRIELLGRNSNLVFFQSYFSATILKPFISYLLTIITIFELIGASTLIYGVYYAFVFKTTLWIFYGFVILAITIIFLLIGQRIAKDYVAASQLVPYFILIMLGIMSMY